jgi:tetratricopeptide (TPR) repeat protein
MRQFLSFLIVFALAAALGWASPVLAQRGASPESSQNVQQAPSQDTPLDKHTPLDKLFQRLREAPNKQAAEPIAAQIGRVFERSGSDTADLLLQRVKTAIEAKQYPLALDLIDHILPLQPDWAEAYHKRAIVHFLMQDHEGAIRDVRATLAREPRHFQALAGLGAIFRELGKTKAAYRAFKTVAEIYPHFDEIGETLDKMRPEVEGQPI